MKWNIRNFTIFCKQFCCLKLRAKCVLKYMVNLEKNLKNYKLNSEINSHFRTTIYMHITYTKLGSDMYSHYMKLLNNTTQFLYHLLSLV